MPVAAFINGICPDCVKGVLPANVPNGRCPECGYVNPVCLVIPSSDGPWKYSRELEAEFSEFESFRLMGRFGGRDPERLANLAHAQKLYLSAYTGFAFHFMAEFTRLLDFELDSTNIENVNGVGALNALRILQFTECRKLSSIRGIEALDRVVSLSFALCNRLQDFSPVSFLKRLRILHIEANSLATLSFLRGCDSLEDLALSIGRVADGDETPLLELPRLRDLTISTKALPRGVAKSLSARLPGVEVRAFTKFW